MCEGRGKVCEGGLRCVRGGVRMVRRSGEVETCTGKWDPEGKT